MSTQQIQINPKDKPSHSQPAVFSPQNVAANAGDNLTWVNNDKQDHWPAPSASDKAGWFPYQIPAGSESGDLALGANAINALGATNASPTVLSTQGPAPATGTTVTLTYKPTNPPPPTESPWLKATNGKSFVVTNLDVRSCSIPLDSTGLGPFTGLLVLGIGGPYTLQYVCALHPAETGTIVVNPHA
ncbi:MAG TPA: hypothetical protein VKU19_39710 [Bryobacteraceae bacterium]|nr:hypothetical protein [Bryobacteraceae bacterium]